jgi:cyclase
MANYGAGEILLTSMERDGTKIGFDNQFTVVIRLILFVYIIFKTCYYLA